MSCVTCEDARNLAKYSMVNAPFVRVVTNITKR